MKKILTVALVVVMVLGLSTAAFAYEKDAQKAPAETEENAEQLQPDETAPELPARPEGEPPALPNGEMPAMPEGEPPALPEGEMPVLPDGEMQGDPSRNNQQGTDRNANLRGMIEDLIEKLKALLENLKGEQQTGSNEAGDQGQQAENMIPDSQGQKPSGNAFPGEPGQRPESTENGGTLPEGIAPAGMRGQENGAVGGTAAGSANYSAAQTVTANSGST